MSHTAVADAIERSCAISRTGERLVLHVLAYHANRSTGLAWPGDQLLMAETGLGRSAVRDAIAGLIAGGYVMRETAGHRSRAAVYRVTAGESWPTCGQSGCRCCDPEWNLEKGSAEPDATDLKGPAIDEKGSGWADERVRLGGPQQGRTFKTNSPPTPSASTSDVAGQTGGGETATPIETPTPNPDRLLPALRDIAEVLSEEGKFMSWSLDDAVQVALTEHLAHIGRPAFLQCARRWWNVKGGLASAGFLADKWLALVPPRPKTGRDGAPAARSGAQLPDPGPSSPEVAAAALAGMRATLANRPWAADSRKDADATTPAR